MRISDKRIEMLSFLWTFAFLLSSSNQSYSFPWLALCDTSPLLMATFGLLSGKWSKCPVTTRLIVWRHHPCQWFHPILSVKMVNAPCHGTAIHLSVLDHAGIGFTILLRLSLTPCNRELGARHSHSIIESYSEYHRQGLDFPDSLECRHHSSLRHEDSG